MSNMPGCRAAWLLFVAAIWTPHGAAAHTIPLHDLAFWERASSTAGCASGFSQCQSGANLPSNFCCSSGSTCDVLAGNTTILCCPAGQSCATINPITCDLSQQDADANPDAPIKTTALEGTLARCGDGTCCPFGYSCNSANLCVVNVNQNAAPIQTVAAPTGTTTKPPSTTTTPSTTRATTHTTSAGVTVVQASPPASTPTNSPTTGTTGTTGAGESAVASADDKSNGTSTASIVGGVIGGLAGLLLVGTAVWFLCGRRLRHRSSSSMRYDPSNLPEKSSGSTSSFGNIINNPLAISSPRPQGDATAYRTDFIRKPPSSSGESSRPVTPAGQMTGSNGGQAAGPSPDRSPLSASLALGLPPSPPPLALRKARDSIAVAPIRGMRSSPPRHPAREPSTEEINIGADPSIMAYGGNFTVSPQETIAPLRTAAAAAGVPRDLETMPSRRRSNDRMTTFSSLMMEANLDTARPFVPGSVQSSPASRRR